MARAPYLYQTAAMGFEPQPPKGKKKRKPSSNPRPPSASQAFPASSALSAAASSTKIEPAEVSGEDRASLRWEGVLSDPVAEARRIDIYKTHRRERYAQQKAFVPSVSQGSKDE